MVSCRKCLVVHGLIMLLLSPCFLVFVVIHLLMPYGFMYNEIVNSRKLDATAAKAVLEVGTAGASINMVLVVCSTFVGGALMWCIRSLVVQQMKELYCILSQFVLIVGTGCYIAGGGILCVSLWLFMSYYPNIQLIKQTFVSDVFIWSGLFSFQCQLVGAGLFSLWLLAVGRQLFRFRGLGMDYQH